MRRATDVRVTLGALGLIAVAACGPRLADRAPLRLLRAEAVASDTTERTDALVFATGSGDSVSAYYRRPTRTPPAGVGGVVLVAGRETGARAARVVPGPLDVAVLAVEYPGALPEALGPGAVLEDLPGIRAAALRVPGLLRGAGHWLAARAEVDADRMVVVGVSFGVPFAAAAGVDTIFQAVALHHGGGDLGEIFDANLPIESGFLRGIAAGFMGWYFRALDPARHVDDYGSRPLLLIQGARDPTVPAASVAVLEAQASGPVRTLWLDHDHLMPGDTLVMRELADSTLAHFDFLGGRPGGRRP